MISLIDLIIIASYLLVMLLIGFLVGRKESIEDYLVNSRKTKPALLIFTLISTNVGMGTFLGLSSSSYETGISYTLSGILAVFLGWLIVAKFAPKIKRFGDQYQAHTFGDFFGIRYSNQNRLLVSIIILVSYFFWMALQFVGIAGLIHVISGLDFQIALFISALITIIYTTVAGIKSDFYTDAIQFWIIVFVLFFVLLPITLMKVGGLSFLSTLPDQFFNPFAFGGPTFFFGAILFGIPIMLVSMEVWQRIYASTTEKEAKKVFVWSSIVNIIFLIPPAILGLAAAKIVPGVTPDFALFELMKNELPVGILGLGIAGILAAAMSTVDSMILVGSATILKDIHKTFINPALSKKAMLRLGRIYTFLFGILGLLTAYLIPHIIQLQIIGAATLMVFAPATIGGFLWKKSTANGSFWSILIGIITTLSLYPILPKTSFIPGTLLSIILFIVISKLTCKKERISSLKI